MQDLADAIRILEDRLSKLRIELRQLVLEEEAERAPATNPFEDHLPL